MAPTKFFLLLILNFLDYKNKSQKIPHSGVPMARRLDCN